MKHPVDNIRRHPRKFRVGGRCIKDVLEAVKLELFKVPMVGIAQRGQLKLLLSLILPNVFFSSATTTRVATQRWPEEGGCMQDG